MKPKLFFRFDASPEVGVGHLRRCVSLAWECMNRGVEVHYLIRRRQMDLDAAGLPSGGGVTEVPWDLEPVAEAGWLAETCERLGVRCGVLDHYRLDAGYQEVCRNAGLRWLQFGNRAHRHPVLGDLLHDASPGAVREHYESRLGHSGTRLLLGPAYALLRPEFAAMHPCVGAGEKRAVEAVLLTFGGGDDRGMTLRALGWLEMGGFGGRVEVLTTKLNPQVDALKAYAQGLGGRIRIHVDNWRPESLMARCQLSITGGGTTLHELACLGVPALVVSLAENQTAPGQAWETAGLGAFLGQAQDLDDQEAVRTVRRFLGDEALRLAVASRCLQVQDGLGAGRVAEALVAWVR